MILTLFLILAYLPERDKNNQDNGLTVEDYLKKVNKKDKMVFVYFNADWCVPCIKLKPVMEQLETEEQARIEMLKLDVDDNPKVSTYLEINSLPLFIIYKNGKSIWTHTGMLSKDDLKYQIEVLQK